MAVPRSEERAGTLASWTDDHVETLIQISDVSEGDGGRWNRPPCASVERAARGCASCLACTRRHRPRTSHITPQDEHEAHRARAAAEAG